MITGRRDETGRGEKKEKEPSVTFFTRLSVILFHCFSSVSFLCIFGPLSCFLFFLFTCCHHLSRAPSSLFSHCCFLCTRPPPSVSGSLALLGLTLCHAGGRSVSGCQLAGRLRDLKEKEKDYIREKRLNDRKQKIAY